MSASRESQPTRKWEQLKEIEKIALIVGEEKRNKWAFQVLKHAMQGNLQKLEHDFANISDDLDSKDIRDQVKIDNLLDAALVAFTAEGHFNKVDQLFEMLHNHYPNVFHYSHAYSCATRGAILGGFLDQAFEYINQFLSDHYDDPFEDEIYRYAVISNAVQAAIDIDDEELIKNIINFFPSEDKTHAMTIALIDAASHCKLRLLDQLLIFGNIVDPAHSNDFLNIAITTLPESITSELDDSLVIKETSLGETSVRANTLAIIKIMKENNITSAGQFITWGNKAVRELLKSTDDINIMSMNVIIAQYLGFNETDADSSENIKILFSLSKYLTYKEPLAKDLERYYHNHSCFFYHHKESLKLREKCVNAQSPAELKSILMNAQEAAKIAKDNPYQQCIAGHLKRF